DTIAAEQPLREYEIAWHRRHGATHAFFEGMRRWNERATPATVSELIGLGLIDADTLRAGIDQTMPRASLARITDKARALASAPSLVGVVARAAAARGVYARYPRRVAGVGAWTRAVDWLLG